MSRSSCYLAHIRASLRRSTAISARYTKTRKELAIYKSLHASNAETYGKLFKENQELNEERFDEYEAKEEFRQKLGYKTVQLEEAQRTIKQLEEVIASLAK